LREPYGQSILGAELHFNSTQRWMGYSYDYAVNQSAQNPPFPGPLVKDGCLYLYQTFFLSSLGIVFYDEFFKGTLNGVVLNSDQLINAVGPRLLENTYDDTNSSFATIDSMFQSMATYLTNYIRQNGNGAVSQQVQGTVLHYATCVHVNWAWLAFPSALAAMSFVQLVWIVVVVALRKAPLWKSSPLAFIYRGPSMGASEEKPDPGNGSAVRGNSDSLEQFEAASKKTIVRLGRSNVALRLEDHTSTSHS
jgi:hypothetical protein